MEKTVLLSWNLKWKNPGRLGRSSFEYNRFEGGHSRNGHYPWERNANKILVRLLHHLMETCQIRLASAEGGDLRNAIPREADAIIAFESTKKEQVEEAVSVMTKTIKAELKLIDPDLKVTLFPAEAPVQIIPEETARKIVRAVYAAPNGVWAMSASMPGLVETSSNLAIFKAKEGKAEVHCLLRSMVDTAKTDMGTALACCFTNIGATSTFSGAYPGWQPNMESPILQVMLKTYKDMYGEDAQVKAIHAGLEYGILVSLSTWDMISLDLPFVLRTHLMNVVDTHRSKILIFWWKR